MDQSESIVRFFSAHRPHSPFSPKQIWRCWHHHRLPLPSLEPLSHDASSAMHDCRSWPSAGIAQRGITACS